jgi:TPP-dependent pyruvate/acetoin dehydrogenase alpha subunit
MMATTVTELDERAVNLDLYRKMATIRYFEEVAYRCYEAGEVLGTIHASIGQEAVAVGTMAALGQADQIFTHHRGHGHALAKGVDPARLFGELLGRRGGLSGGKGGSMHATDAAVGFLGSLAVVGGSIPLAVGVALAAKLRGTGGVGVAFFGDGAVNQGVLYESMNLAAIWSLPVLFVCENNGYAISVPSNYSIAGPGLVARAQAFGIEAQVVDGQSVTSVARVAEELAARARAGHPALIEARTYRLLGHSRGDPAYGLYRTQEEVQRWRERDPLTVHAAVADIDPAARETIAAEIQQLIDGALEESRRFPVPPLDDAMRDVWG